ncbi:MAG: aminotransferase class I/II-fold pyridoxal phosphate-dependent enzyme [Candidatus Marinimicrobia bacterium]|jgi:hypothetical protein|nr:aminotransferase class I/II-fold pyridoxal phosphate-dependent enzyme [Candidatus Neomarinimicrobiota bacterium]MDP6966231.1 aminotransferase class I/II-fold pyridoxal phosphate-dependent enzyme [Candidatus Neomarinimicrobiota bacterium]|tara:strand:+ start:6301 stop:7428 length:1128 start_codon:yes stop_codon:yes gene_type:complete
MKFEPFELERNMSQWENVVDYNLSESGVHPLSLKEILTAEELDELSEMELLYCQANGTEELRRAICGLYPHATPDNILVTNGSAEANFLTIMTLLEPGDELIYMMPNYLQIWGFARSLGVEVRPIRLRDDHGWQIDVDELASLITPQTKMISVCNPNNPTGAVMDCDIMMRVRELAREHDLWLHSDEVYRGAELSGEESSSFYSGHEKDIVVAGLSKAYRLPGLRLGWMVANPDFIWKAWSLHDYTTISIGTLSDWVASRILQPERRTALLSDVHDFLRNNLKILQGWVDGQDGLFSFTPPQAAAIAFLRCHFDGGSVRLIEQIRDEQSVLVMPGKWFGMENYIRVGYGTPADYLKAGLDRMAQMLNAFRIEATA